MVGEWNDQHRWELIQIERLRLQWNRIHYEQLMDKIISACVTAGMAMGAPIAAVFVLPLSGIDIQYIE